MEHIEVIVAMALVPIGAWVAMGEGMVLEWWAQWWTGPRKLTEVEEHIRHMERDGSPLPSRFPTWLQKPLATCPRCMVSAWGTPAALLLFPDLNLWLLPVYMLAACGLQEMMHR